MEPIIINKRATLFLSQPQLFDEINMPQYFQALTPLRLMPSFNQGVGFNIKPDGTIEQQKTINLEMKKLDNSLVVTFSPDRIDIVSSKSDETIQQFYNEAEPIIQAIGQVYPYNYSRLALFVAAMYNVDAVVMDKIYSSNINVAENENPSDFVEWSVRKVSRVELKNAGRNVIVNNVTNLSRTTVQIGTSAPKDRILQELDINTMPNQNPEKIVAMQGEFYKYALSSIVNLLKISI